MYVWYGSPFCGLFIGFHQIREGEPNTDLACFWLRETRPRTPIALERISGISLVWN